MSNYKTYKMTQTQITWLPPAKRKKTKIDPDIYNLLVERVREMRTIEKKIGRMGKSQFLEDLHKSRRQVDTILSSI